MLTDKALTDLVNYVVFTAAAAQLPLDAKVYSVGEVSELRRRPLTELCLLVNHRAMVRLLVDDHHASQKFTLVRMRRLRQSTIITGPRAFKRNVDTAKSVTVHVHER